MREFVDFLENLPPVKALDLEGLPRWKKHELMMSDEQREKRNARRRARYKALSAEDKKAYRAKGAARAKKHYLKAVGGQLLTAEQLKQAHVLREARKGAQKRSEAAKKAWETRRKHDHS